MIDREVSELEGDAMGTQRVMLVEDEMIVAFDLCDQIEEGGFEIDGPYASVRNALAALSENKPGCAVLDVRLIDGSVYPVADRLRDLGVPLLFHSGHADAGELNRRYPDARICSKPSRAGLIRAAVTEMMRNGPEARA